MQITNTKDIAAKHIKVLVHGPAGAGKTRLCATTGGKPLIISAESGLLSLKGFDLDVVTVTDMTTLQEVYQFLKTDTTYDWVCIDSLSEVAEVCLSSEKAKTADGRKAYGETNDIMAKLIRAFRDLPKNIYMAAKQDRVKDDVTGGIYFGGSMPGKTLTNDLAYYFDEVFAYQTWKDEQGVVHRMLQTQRDNQYDAKDRSGVLDFAEEPNLARIYQKITSTETTVAQGE